MDRSVKEKHRIKTINKKIIWSARATHGDVADLLAAHVAQLLDQSSDQLHLLLRELRKQLFQQGLQLGQTVA